jgi:hypothetical protein
MSIRRPSGASMVPTSSDSDVGVHERAPVHDHEDREDRRSTNYQTATVRIDMRVSL